MDAVRLQRTGVGVHGGSIRLARSLGQDTFFFRMATGFHDRRTRRRPLRSTPNVSPDQYPWPAQLSSRRGQEIRAADGGENRFLHSVTVESTRVGVGILPRRGCRRPLLMPQAAVLLFSVVVACALAVFCGRPTLVPRSKGSAESDIVGWTFDDAAISAGGVQSWSRTPHPLQSWPRAVECKVRRFIFNYFMRKKPEKWPNTFQLNYSALWQPIGPVTRRNTSLEAWLGRPIKQRKNAGTCSLVACTVAVEATHRLVYEGRHGKGTFRWRAADPHKQLLEDCSRTNRSICTPGEGACVHCKNKTIYTPGEGAYVHDVLKLIREKGLPLANPPSQAQSVLNLMNWTKHEWRGADGLTHDRVAKLLDAGPCVGSLWVCPWYSYFMANGDEDDAWVYKGCGQDESYKNESKRLYGGEAGRHAVVCFGYRFCGDQMHVLVLDNHSHSGPRRWVDVCEFDELHTLDVDCLDVPPTRKRKRHT
ncbi:hypothetical protein ACP70R_042113 [Stipagrostis hirtigluma subsp. patula]